MIFTGKPPLVLLGLLARLLLRYGSHKGTGPITGTVGTAGPQKTDREKGDLIRAQIRKLSKLICLYGG